MRLSIFLRVRALRLASRDSCRRDCSSATFCFRSCHASALFAFFLSRRLTALRSSLGSSRTVSPCARASAASHSSALAASCAPQQHESENRALRAAPRWPSRPAAPCPLPPARGPPAAAASPPPPPAWPSGTACAASARRPRQPARAGWRGPRGRTGLRAPRPRAPARRRRPHPAAPASAPRPRADPSSAPPSWPRACPAPSAASRGWLPAAPSARRRWRLPWRAAGRAAPGATARGRRRRPPRHPRLHPRPRPRCDPIPTRSPLRPRTDRDRRTPPSVPPASAAQRRASARPGCSVPGAPSWTQT